MLLPKDPATEIYYLPFQRIWVKLERNILIHWRIYTVWFHSDENSPLTSINSPFSHQILLYSFHFLCYFSHSRSPCNCPFYVYWYSDQRICILLPREVLPLLAWDKNLNCPLAFTDHSPKFISSKMMSPAQFLFLLVLWIQGKESRREWRTMALEGDLWVPIFICDGAGHVLQDVRFYFL